MLEQYLVISISLYIGIFIGYTTSYIAVKKNFNPLKAFIIGMICGIFIVPGLFVIGAYYIANPDKTNSKKIVTNKYIDVFFNERRKYFISIYCLFGIPLGILGIILLIYGLFSPIIEINIISSIIGIIIGAVSVASLFMLWNMKKNGLYIQTATIVLGNLNIYIVSSEMFIFEAICSVIVLMLLYNRYKDMD